MAIRVNVRQSATLAKNHKKYMAIIGEMEMASFNDEVPRWAGKGNGNGNG